MRLIEDCSECSSKSTVPNMQMMMNDDKLIITDQVAQFVFIHSLAVNCNCALGNNSSKLDIRKRNQLVENLKLQKSLLFPNSKKWIYFQHPCLLLAHTHFVVLQNQHSPLINGQVVRTQWRSEINQNSGWRSVIDKEPSELLRIVPHSNR